MEYRLLGNTGLKVSVISFGNWLNSNNPDWQERTNLHVKKAWDLGINFFDTAEVYGFGEGEKQFGVALKALNVPREELVISTKIFWGTMWGDKKRVNQLGLNRKHIKEGVKNSLKRLQLDYVDIVFCHRYDHETPLEEIARAFTELIQEGYIHYWGTSEWTSSQIYELREVCAEKCLIKPSAEQPQYNMFVRQKFEVDYARLFDKARMGSTVWSPLAGGILTGKYNIGGIPSGARWEAFNEDFYLQGVWESYFAADKKEKLIKLLTSLESLAKELGMTQAQLAMCWVIANKDVSTAITGCSRPEQLEETVKCVELYKKITPEVIKKVDEILDNIPDQGVDFKTFLPFPPRR
ncbi:aldo/keto reductase family oxidoreductase (macronuclear) [Tetrahymena thermophila SB210]|uniref:Aldo/keto reductase family oxidoreductase n=1 Tax=Tetrahymena thermophila (strain SB210) TaxID=312017 RepID=Q22C35_TETTS|nr:aldo/keto reductase family oxidoreductase [Tetrahymena thermophila SB210]EAR82827.1 aldo/keto reductase family oxidoreductase [Tetrahymena thermophila SB210]|eukprot:XP_001030490.1 aldo/keto reductase family oxidoreductase [Tetrahymena thermophila SB210]